MYPTIQQIQHFSGILPLPILTISESFPAQLPFYWGKNPESDSKGAISRPLTVVFVKQLQAKSTSKWSPFEKHGQRKKYESHQLAGRVVVELS